MSNHIRKIFLALAGILLVMAAYSQEFDKNIAMAMSAYDKGDLEDTRFNLQNALKDIDITIGKEILKVLPTTMNGMEYMEQADNVTGMSSSFVGLFVHREYGATPASARIEVMSDSPVLGSVNAFLSMPMMMNGGDPDQKVVKIHGYKSLFHVDRKDDRSVAGYEVQVPFTNSMLTFHIEGDPGEARVMELVNGLPIEQLVKLAQ